MDVLFIWSGLFTAIGFWIMLFLTVVVFFGRIVNPTFGENSSFGYWFAIKIFVYPLIIFIIVAVISGNNV